MKKTVLTLACVAGFAGGVLAQGVVTWNNVGGFVICQTNSTAFSSFEASGNAAQLTAQNGSTLGNASTVYYYELLVSSTATAAPTTVQQLSSWLDTGLSAENGAGSNGRILQTNPGNADVANNLAAGATDNDILVGWSANLGSTWSAAYAMLQNWSTEGIAGAYFGVSEMGNLQGIASPGPGNQPFGVGAGQISAESPNQMQLDILGVAVPEPGTMALAAIGGASLLLFRRKK